MVNAAAEILIEHARPWSEGARLEGADTLALADGRILAVGRAADLAPLATPATRRIDAAGATVTPGLTDAHLHLVGWARALDELGLAGAETRDAAVARVAAYARERTGGSPIVGRGWDDAAWTAPADRAALDAVAPDRPVLLHRRDFHALWVNGAALRAAGVTRDTKDPDGGRLVRDAAGEPTGLVLEHAVRLFAALEAPLTAEDDGPRVRRAMDTLFAYGITALHDFEGPAAFRLLHAMADGGRPCPRVLMHLAHAGLDDALALGLRSGIGDDRFRIGAVKLFADGTLGSRTAAMLAPYEGTAETGMDLIAPAELRALVARAIAGGLSVAIHAIGDRANRSALDAIQAAGPARGRVALPPRIEHAQLLDPADVPRFEALGVAASMQPIHAVEDRRRATRDWGARCGLAYAWRSVLQTGALVAFGSDAPVESPDPALGLQAATTRAARGEAHDPFVPAERIALDAALRLYTETPAKLAGQWPRVGRLAPGAAADVVVWNADLHAMPPARLDGARAAVTVLGGEVVFTGAPETAAAGAGGTAG